MPDAKQGDRFEPIAGTNAAWVAPDSFFIFQSPPTRDMLRHELPNGKVSFGFNAQSVGEQMGISAAEVMAANADRSLSGKEDKMPSVGMTTSLRYRFTLPDRQAAEFLVDLQRP